MSINTVALVSIGALLLSTATEAKLAATTAWTYPIPTETARYASSLASQPPSSYSASSTALVSLLPNATYTTWAKLSPNATDAAGPYGNAALYKLWSNYTSITTANISTTVSPTVAINGWDYGTGPTGEGGGNTTPELFRQGLNYVAAKYPSDGGYMLTELGLSEAAPTTSQVAQFDTLRSQYFEQYTEATWLAMTVDKIKVIGMLAWSFVDDYEFGGQPYGLQYVNPTTLARAYKKSMFTFIDLFS